MCGLSLAWTKQNNDGRRHCTELGEMYIFNCHRSPSLPCVPLSFPCTHHQLDKTNLFEYILQVTQPSLSLLLPFILHS